MNKVILIGNLTRDPEAFTTQSGVSRSTFTVAVQRRFANAQGVREADFIPVVAWRQSADFVNRYLTKGSKVAVEGSMQVRSYDAQDGSKRYVTEVIADSVESVGSRGDSQGQARPRDNGPTIDLILLWECAPRTPYNPKRRNAICLRIEASAFADPAAASRAGRFARFAWIRSSTSITRMWPGSAVSPASAARFCPVA